MSEYEYYSDSSDDEVEVIINEFTLSSSEDEDKPLNERAYTKMCSHMLEKGICERNKCSFAHTIEQLRPLKCKYDDKCINERCTFIHTREDKDEYCKRMNIVIKTVPKTKNKKIIPHLVRTTIENVEEDIKIQLASGNKCFTIFIEEK